MPPAVLRRTVTERVRMHGRALIPTIDSVPQPWHPCAATDAALKLHALSDLHMRCAGLPGSLVGVQWMQVLWTALWVVHRACSASACEPAALPTLCAKAAFVAAAFELGHAQPGSFGLSPVDSFEAAAELLSPFGMPERPRLATRLREHQWLLAQTRLFGPAAGLPEATRRWPRRCG